MAPLSQVRVLDVTRLLPGGFCSHLLSRFGAEVVKVEEPGKGDYMRVAPPTYRGVSLVYTMLNRGKRSIAIDLKNPRGREVLERLIERSDVFVEGFRPGVVDRLGFSYERVRELNSRMVYCSITAFGGSSPLSAAPGHDLNFEAMAGLLGVSEPPSVPFVQLGDYVAGMYAATAILAALSSKGRKATRIDVPIVPSLLSLLAVPASSYFATGKPPAHGQSLLFGSEPYYGIYETSDGRYLAVAAIEPAFWRNLMSAMGLSKLARLRDGGEREKARLRRAMRRAFSLKTRDEWSRLLLPAETCVTPVLDIPEALASDWAREAGVVGSVSGKPVLNLPVGSCAPGRDAPTLGAHTKTILRELGYAPGVVTRLFRGGAVA